MLNLQNGFLINIIELPLILSLIIFDKMLLQIIFLYAILFSHFLHTLDIFNIYSITNERFILQSQLKSELRDFMIY
jgi:hypothetical protein